MYETQSGPTSLPSEVAPVVASLVTELEQALPQQIEGVYLVGSLALGDFRPGQSDIDFLTVVDHAADLSTLTDVHRALAAKYKNVHCDGIYLRSGELACPPAGTGPSAREGDVNFASGDERHAVTWLTLLRHGITVRGSRPSRAWIAADETAAAAYSRLNLHHYWQPWLDQKRNRAELDDWSVIWGCLGVARLHAAMVDHEMVSKSAGGLHALEHFPQHRSIIEEALRLREGGSSAYPSSTTRTQDLIVFMDDVISSTRHDRSGNFSF